MSRIIEAADGRVNEFLVADTLRKENGVAAGSAAVLEMGLKQIKPKLEILQDLGIIL
jgi:hypothetical protein